MSTGREMQDVNEHQGYVEDRLRHTERGPSTLREVPVPHSVGMLMEKTPLAEATAAKYQKDPVWMGVLARFPMALREIARVSAFGTKKHQVPMDDMSYLTVPDAYGVYTDADARHLLGEAIEGPVNLDPKDGGMLHPAQHAWNALARLEVFLRKRAGMLK